MPTDYKTEATLVAGVMRWKSNGRVPPVECCREALAQGLDVDLERCTAERDAETRAFLTAYRANPPQPTAEDFAEMRAAFGPGSKVVNIITGQSWEV